MNWENLMWLTIAAICTSIIAMLPSIFGTSPDTEPEFFWERKPFLKWSHHAVIWVFGLCAAPFSSGISMAMVPIAYLAIALDREKRREN